MQRSNDAGTQFYLHTMRGSARAVLFCVWLQSRGCEDDTIAKAQLNEACSSRTTPRRNACSNAASQSIDHCILQGVCLRIGVGTGVPTAVGPRCHVLKLLWLQCRSKDVRADDVPQQQTGVGAENSPSEAGLQK